MDWISLACCLLAFLLYYNTLDAGFVYDDRRAILSNPDLLPSTPWWNLLENDFWGTPLTDNGSHGSYRPLCVFSFRLNYLLGGFQPWGYHLVNVLLHCLATALVVRVARALLPPNKTKLGSAIAGLTFASHPIHTEAVAGVVGRADLAACNFYLMSFLVYVAHVKYRDCNPNYTNLVNHNVGYSNGCCFPRCTTRINGITPPKKTYRKPTRRSCSGTNGHVVANGHAVNGDNDLIGERKNFFLYAEHNILVYLIENIKRCNWFGKVEEFGAGGGIVCVIKFFLSFGINTWQLKKQQLCNNNSIKTMNGDIKKGSNHMNGHIIESTSHMNGHVVEEKKINGIIGHSNGVVLNGHSNGVAVNGSAVLGDDPKARCKCCSGKGWSVGFGWKKHLALAGCVLLAGAATLSKETGVTALAACALYDLVRAAQDATWNNKRRIFSLGMLFAALVALLVARVPLSATPKFARADNPTAREPSVVTRFLTFHYLPVFNFFLLICPTTLSFDWSMDAVPRITSILDPRNLLSIIFYFFIFKTIWKSASAVYKQGEQKTKQNNLQRKDNISKLHQNYAYAKNGTNGRCLKVNRSNLIYQFNNFCGYTSVIKSGKVIFSGARVNGKTIGACTCCRHLLTDHHSNSCRAVNNNNSMTQSSTCTCQSFVTLASVATWPQIEKPKPQHTSKRSSHSVILLAASFLTLPFLPATNLFFYVGFVVAERVLYLPSVGFSLLVGLGGAKVGAKLGKRARVAALGALLIALSARTVSRNKDWRDEESLYRSAVGVNPPKAFGNLGSVLSGLGRLQEAEVAFHEALRHRPNMADVHYNLGALLQGRRQYEEAILSFERAIHFRPSLAVAYVNLGASLAALGRCGEAAGVLARGARLDGASVRDRRAHEAARASALQALGALHAVQGRPRRALAAYQQALLARPPDYRPQKLYALMSESLSRLQRWSEAEKYKKAALAEPHSSPIKRPPRGRVKAAIRSYRRVLRNETSLSSTASQEETKNHKIAWGKLVSLKGRKVVAEKVSAGAEARAQSASGPLSEPDMFVAKCRIETPKSCCT